MGDLKPQSLGAVLVAQGRLTERRLNDALVEQKRTGRRLGQILLESNYVTEEEIAQALAAQQSLPYIDLRHYELNPEITSHLSELQARQYRAIVLEDRGETYLVGLSDPFNMQRQDALAAVLKRPLDIAVVAEDQLTLTIDRLYRKKEQLQEYVQAVESDVERDTNIINLNQISASLDDVDAPVVKLLQSMFREAIRLRASDIHVEPQDKKLRIRYRVDGALSTQVETDLKIAPILAVKLKLMAGMDISEKRLPQDGRITVKVETRQIDIRMSTMPTQFGESIVMRLLIQSEGMRDLGVLGMADTLLKQFERAIRLPSGIILSTGPTGSGKTTTLYGALARLNNPDVKILTCEDPVEYRIAGINQVQVNEKIGLTFPRVLRSFLRQDPDILLIGEIRDNETAEIAIRAAMTGHMVLSTLHTNDAVSVPSRLIDMGVPGYMIAATLRGVLSQRLLRLVCTECAEPHEPTLEESEWLTRYVKALPAGATLKHGKGCSHCNGTGFSGRVGVFEFLEMNRTLAATLHRDDPLEFETAAQAQIGAESLVHHGLALAYQGKTTIAEVMRNAVFFD